jgi:hypothetical protein
MMMTMDRDQQHNRARWIADLGTASGPRRSLDPTALRPDTAIAGIFLRTAQLAGNASFIIDTHQPRLTIIARNTSAESLIPASQTSLTDGDCFARMTFFELHSHLLLVATDSKSRCGRAALLGDPLATRRRIALLKVPNSLAGDIYGGSYGDAAGALGSGLSGGLPGGNWVMLMIGKPGQYRESEDWSVVTEHPADIMLRFCDGLDGR